MPAWSVRVPASTSNLGPGFDQLGLCLSLWLEVRLERHGHGPEGSRIEVRGPEGWPETTDDRLVAALLRVAGPLEGGLTLSVASEIPIGRGLGSSGAATAAGLLLGRALLGDLDPDPNTLLAPGIALEGHPDNVTASLLGGCTTCVPIDGAEPAALEHAVHPTIGVVAAWPDQPLETPRARAALPATVPFADAVENARRLPLLLAGLRAADPRLLALGTQDRLHERYRLPLLPGATEALDAARRAGAWAANVSGAGSGLVALCPLEARERVLSALAEPVGAARGAVHGRVLEIVRDAPRVQRGDRT